MNTNNSKKLQYITLRINENYSVTFIDVKGDDWFQVERFYSSMKRGNYQSKNLCLPFFAILNAVGNPIVDYFSLDVEGAEFSILMSIPWEKVVIKVRNCIYFTNLSVGKFCNISLYLKVNLLLPKYILIWTWKHICISKF